MKKLVAILMALSMIFCFSACGNAGGHEYSDYDLTKYVTIGDFSGITVSEPDVQITDDMIDDRIELLCEQNYTEEKVTEGTVDNGDVIDIAFHGTLDDGTTDDGMNTDSYQMVLGSGTMIPGFEEAIYGATIGEQVTAEIAFPDPYQNDPELSGRGVTFVITVNSKTVKVPAAYDEALMEKISGGTAKDDASFRKYLKGVLYDEEYENQMTEIKTDLYNSIYEVTEISGTISEEVEKEHDALVEKYQQYAQQYGMEFADFIQQYMGQTEEQFEEEASSYAEQMVTEKMMIYALADKTGIKVTDKDYQDELDRVLEYYQCSDSDEFKSKYGVTLEEYAETYGVKLNLTLDMALQTIYEDLLK